MAELGEVGVSVRLKCYALSVSELHYYCYIQLCLTGLFSGDHFRLGQVAEGRQVKNSKNCWCEIFHRPNALAITSQRFQAVVTTTILLRFDGRLTTVRLLINYITVTMK